MVEAPSSRELSRISLTGSAAEVAENWKRWRRSFSYYVEGKGIVDPLRLKSLLLHYAGAEVQDLFEDLVDPGNQGNPDEGNLFKAALRTLDKHFEVQPNTPFERHKFRQISFQQGETCDQFVVRLRRQARYCQYGGTVEEHIRDQLIDRLPNSELKKKMLQERNVTLDRAMEIARTWEAAGEQASVMSSAPATVNAVRDGSWRKSAARGGRQQNNSNGSRQHSQCYNCGQQGHFARDQSCPARGKECSNCGKIGHFSGQCRSPKKPSGDEGQARK